jgi:hypothetical protein
MKRLMAGLVILAVAALTGCNTSTSTPAGPTGLSTSARTSSYPPPNDVARPPVAGEPARPAPADTGRPGATDTGRGAAPVIGSNEPFKLRGPGVLGISDVTLKQGEKKEIKVSVNRGPDFKEGVRLQVKNAPKGLTVMPAKPEIPAGDDQVTVTVEAAKDAPLGAHMVDLVGTPENGKGPEQTLQLKVTVEKGGEEK